MKSNCRSYEKFKSFTLEIIVELISKNQPNHYTSQQIMTKFQTMQKRRALTKFVQTDID